MLMFSYLSAVSVAIAIGGMETTPIYKRKSPKTQGIKRLHGQLPSSDEESATIDENAPLGINPNEPWNNFDNVVGNISPLNLDSDTSFGHSTDSGKNLTNLGTAPMPINEDTRVSNNMAMANMNLGVNAFRNSEHESGASHDTISNGLDSGENPDSLDINSVYQGFRGDAATDPEYFSPLGMDIDTSFHDDEDYYVPVGPEPLLLRNDPDSGTSFGRESSDGPLMSVSMPRVTITRRLQPIPTLS